MSNSGGSIKWDNIREIAGSSLTTSYQPLGAVLLRDGLLNWFTNNTNGDIYLSDDGVNDKMKFPSGSGRAYDSKANDMFLKAGTQISIRFATAPGIPSGWAAMEVNFT